MNHAHGNYKSRAMMGCPETRGMHADGQQSIHGLYNRVTTSHWRSVHDAEKHSYVSKTKRGVAQKRRNSVRSGTSPEEPARPRPAGHAPPACPLGLHPFTICSHPPWSSPQILHDQHNELRPLCLREPLLVAYAGCDVLQIVHIVPVEDDRRFVIVRHG